MRRHDLSSAHAHLGSRALCLASVFLLLLHIPACPPAFAQCVDYPSYLHYLGSSPSPIGLGRCLEVEGGYAYQGEYGSMVITDVTNPAAPHFAWSEQNGAQGLDVQGNRLYIAGHDPDLRVFDLGDPDFPWLISSLSIPGDSYDVVVVGTHAYITGEHLFHIVDLTDEWNPVLVSTIPIPNNAVRFAVRDGYAWLPVMETGLVVVDVNDPSQPSIVGTYDTPDIQGGLALAGAYAYLPTYNSDVVIIDITVPSAPVQVGQITTYPTEGTPYGVTVIGGFLYVFCMPPGALESTVVYDLANPLAPTLVGGIAPGGFVADAGGFACVATANAVRTLDISNPASPPIFGGAPVGGDGMYDDVAASFPYAYCAIGNYGVRVVNVSNPAAPFVVSTYDTPGAAQGVFLHGYYALVADGNSGVEILDVAAPEAPSLVGAVDTYDAQDVVASGSFAYVADGWGAFKVLNIGNPASPFVAGQLGGLPYVRAVGLCGSHVLVAETYNGGLHAVDVSNPASPHIDGTLAISGVAGLAVNGSVVYAILVDHGLRVVNFADPAHPISVLNLALPDTPLGVTLEGTTLYVVGGSMGVLAYDVTNPVNPVFLGSANTPGRSQRVDVDGGYVYVSNRGIGLRILAAQCQDPAAAPGASGLSGLPFTAGPNPMLDATDLRFVLGAPALVDLSVYDAGGRRVRTVSRGFHNAGLQQMKWDGLDDAGRRVGSGVYHARLLHDGCSESRSIVVLR